MSKAEIHADAAREQLDAAADMMREDDGEYASRVAQLHALRGIGHALLYVADRIDVFAGIVEESPARSRT